MNDPRNAHSGLNRRLVLTQDIQLLAGLQRDKHQPGFTHLVLSGKKRRVTNMHRNLERYLDLPEAERMSDGAAGRMAPM
jgi:choline monooxygenase